MAASAVPLLASLDPILFDVAVLFGLCVLVVLVFHRLRLPPIVGFLLTGALIGPNALGLIGHQELVDQLAEVGVVILLFSVGMELPLRHLGQMKRALLVGGGLQMGLTLGLGAAGALLGGLSWGAAILLGLLLMMSSTAVALKLLSDRGELNAPAGRLGVAILVAQDLAVVPVILLLPLLAGKGESALQTLGNTGLAFLGLVVVFVAGKLLAPRLMDQVTRTRSREAFVLSLIGLCLAMAVATGHLGLSLALGAFLAGVVLADSDYHHMAVAEIAPIRDALSSLFFVSIGMLFDPRVLFERPFALLIALAAVIVGKALVLVVVGRVLGRPTWLGLRTGLLLAQVGEFSFVIMQIADKSLLPERWREVFLAVAVLSIAATPLLYGLSKYLRRGGAAPSEAAREGAKRVDHAIVVGFGPTGQALAGALQQLKLPFVAIEMNASTVKAQKERGVDIFMGDSTRDPVLMAAGIRRARVLVLAINDPAATRNTAALARRLAPSLHIVARAAYLGEVEGLERVGVNDVVPQELETAVEITARALRVFLVPDDKIDERVRVVRQSVPGNKKVAPAATMVPLDVGSILPNMRVEIAVVQAKSAAAGHSLVELHFRKRTGVNIIAFKRGDDVRTSVDPEQPLLAGDVLVMIGPVAGLREATDLLRGADGIVVAASTSAPGRATSSPHE